MKVTFYGAAGEVTGSCYLVETGQARVLVDFGMHQGDPESERINRQPPPLNAPKLDAVVLTHAHLDHSGLLPLLNMGKYEGRILCTPATMDLVQVLLEDSARIQEGDTERENKARVESGLPTIAPNYSLNDVQWTASRLQGLPYWEWREIAPGVKVRLADAGHIIGSASVEMVVSEGGTEKRVVFSGDIGQDGAPLIRDPTELRDADVLILESTYGDRDHKSREETIEEFVQAIDEAVAGGGKVLIPAFAVGRTQELIFEFGKLQRAGRLKAEVFIDSPMAIEATQIYRRHRHLFDGHAQEMISEGESPLRFEGLQFVRSSQESKQLNVRGGIIVIAGSGMCTGGRILFHLKHNLGNPETHVIFVGYQAEGTLGRRLVEREPVVEVLGERVVVKAKIHTIGGFSAHAGQSGLVKWARHFDPAPSQIILTHGEDKARKPMAERIRREIEVECLLPRYGESVEF
jgi:metallo-beta-lactamase family protein